MEIKDKLNEYLSKDHGFNELLHFQIDEAKKGYVEGHFDLSGELLNIHGGVHGGALYSVADLAGGLAVLTNDCDCTTVSGTFNYMRPAMNTDYVKVTATELRHGGHIAVSEVRLFDDKDKLLDEGTFNYFILEIPD